MAMEAFELSDERYKIGEKEAFKIDNDSSAEWALRKISQIEQKYLRAAELCQTEIEFYQSAKLEAAKQRDNEKGYFLSQLAMYFETLPYKTTKTQSTYSFPSGKLIKKLEKQELKKDDAVLIKTLEGTEFVENKPSLKWGEFKKTLTIIGDKVIDDNGEVVEGISIVIKPASFDVEVG